MRLFGLDIRRAADLTDLPGTAALRERVLRLEMQFQELDAAHSQLQAHHVKLRNQFHGAKGGRPVESVAQPTQLDMVPRGDKRALRAYARTLGHNV